jgi:hypothetical protein
MTVYPISETGLKFSKNRKQLKTPNIKKSVKVQTNVR